MIVSALDPEGEDFLVTPIPEFLKENEIQPVLEGDCGALCVWVEGRGGDQQELLLAFHPRKQHQERIKAFHGISRNSKELRLANV